MWKNISFLSENFQFLEVKFSIYLNRRVFVMKKTISPKYCLLLEPHMWLSTSKIGQPILLDKRGFQVNIFLSSPWKYLLWVFIRSAELAECVLKVKSHFIYQTCNMQVSWSIDTNHQYHNTISSQKILWYIDALIILPQLYNPVKGVWRNYM